MNTNTYKIPVENLLVLNEKIAKINRKAVKRGFDKIVLVPVGERIAEKSTSGVRWLQEVSVSAATVGIAGYTFIGRVSFEHSSPTVFAVPGMTMPINFRNTDCHCDHCNINRRRNDVFVLKNDADNAYIQVGRSCLADFLGHDPKNILSYMEWVSSVSDMCGEAEGGLDGVAPRFDRDVVGFLAKVDVIMNECGWVSSKTARERGQPETATWSVAWGDFFGRPFYHMKNENFEYAEKAIVWLKNKVENENNLSDYFYNLSVAVGDGYVTEKDAPLVASLIMVWKNDIAAKVERENTMTGGFVGTVGKRDNFTVTLAKVVPIEGMYGTTEIHNFVDSEGHALVWFASTNSGMEEGKTYEVKATVKNHKIFRGVEQTLVSRVKVEKEI